MRGKILAVIFLVTSLISAMLAILPAIAVAITLKADYRFQNNLKSSVGSPPALVNIGSNTFGSDTVGGATTTILRFNQNNGLSLANASSVTPVDSYTIAILFAFDSITDYRRILDFKNGGSDTGLYNQDGILYFYNVQWGTSAVIPANTYVQAAITRDAAKNVKGYINGVEQFSFLDTSDYGVISAADTLRFFVDDNVVQNEASAGSVARILIYDGALSAAAVSALQLSAPTGPVSWWKGEGNANDSAGSNNGILMNGATSAAGLVGKAFSLDGNNDYVSIPKIVDNWAQGTISAWVKYNNSLPGINGTYIFSASANIPLTGSWDGTNLGIHPAYGGNDLRFGIYTSGWQWAASGIVPVIGQWYHVAGTWGPGGIKIYIDGALKGTNGYTGASSLSNYNIIGASSWPGSVVNGLIDEFQIYNRALDATEITALYSGGAASVAVDGVCGTAHGQTFAAPPSSNLCSVGTASSVNGGSIWTWTCSGINNGTTAACSASRQITFSAVSAFSTAHGNPNGVWSYGWKPTDFSQFNLYVNSNAIQWYGWNSDGTPTIWLNNGSASYYGVPPGWLSVHPGPGTEPSVLRWTAPYDGPVHISGQFLPGDSGTMQVAVQRNNQQLWQAVNSGTFDLSSVVSSGDTIDFVVYGGYGYGNTPLDVTVTYQFCTAPPSGLISWWRGENNAADSTGANNGTLVNGTAFADGMSGRAFSFDGANNYADMGPIAGNFSSSDFTLAFWMKTSSSRYEGVMGNRIACGYGNSWDLRTYNGRLRFEPINPSQYIDVSPAVAINDGVFHYVTIVREGTTFSVFVDGQSGATAQWTGDISSGGHLLMGKSACTGVDGTYYFTGLLDDVQIYNRAVSASEIASLYNAGSAGICAGSYTVTTNNPAHGGISPLGSIPVANGISQAFTLTPDEGYQILSAKGCGGSLTGTTYTTGPIAENCNVEVIFAKISAIPRHILYVTQPENGRVLVSPTGKSCGAGCYIYNEGQRVTVAARAAKGYIFMGWGDSCEGKGTCRITINEYKTVSANFEQPLPAMNLSDNSIAFGNGRTGKLITKTIKITNNGIGDLRITSVQITGNNANMFSSSSSKITLRPNSSFNLQVMFKPKSEGNKTAKLIINSNAPNNPAMEVPLSGTGTAR